MEALIPQLIAAIPTAALPLVFVIVACWFIYWKIQSQRKETKKERDEAHDNLVTRVTLLEHDVEFMKQQNSIFGQKLDRILDELTSIKVELAKKEDK
jgi:LPS sulfotransferase NodH